MSPRAVGLFAKPAILGGVKTRLVPPLTRAQAVDLYRAFLEDVTHTLDAGPAWDWHVFSTDPPRQRETWPDGAGQPAGWHLQEGGDLGERMHRALEALLARGYERALLVGSDHPTLPRRLLEAGFQALDGADVVLGPSQDGGYYLVGVRAPHPEIFRDIPWSGPEVLARTQERGRAAGLATRTLAPWFDVDRPPDLLLLRRQLLEPAGGGLPPEGARTLAVLRRLPEDLWSALEREVATGGRDR